MVRKISQVLGVLLILSLFLPWSGRDVYGYDVVVGYVVTAFKGIAIIITDIVNSKEVKIAAILFAILFAFPFILMMPIIQVLNAVKIYLISVKKVYSGKLDVIISIMSIFYYCLIVITSHMSMITYSQNDIKYGHNLGSWIDFSSSIVAFIIGCCLLVTTIFYYISKINSKE